MHGTQFIFNRDLALGYTSLTDQNGSLLIMLALHILTYLFLYTILLVRHCYYFTI